MQSPPVTRVHQAQAVAVMMTTARGRMSLVIAAAVRTQPAVLAVTQVTPQTSQTHPMNPQTLPLTRLAQPFFLHFHFLLLVSIHFFLFSCWSLSMIFIFFILVIVAIITYSSKMRLENKMYKRNDTNAHCCNFIFPFFQLRYIACVTP